ncbi:MAG: putative hydrolase [Frankiales bacterium]|nr:putative hydrolase [Frankiales bacterium]
MRRSACAAAFALSVAACSSSSNHAAVTPTPAGTASARASSVAPAIAPPGPAPAVGKVLTIVEENHGFAAARHEMPYLASLARSYGQATSYATLTHPSLPNYLAMAGGSTFGVSDDRSPSAHPLSGASVFGRALATHHTAKTYADAMPSACAQSPQGRYGVKHNPWAYFPSERASCAKDDLPAGTPSAGALHDDLARGTLPNVGLLVPDLCNDAHDCSLGTADGYLKQWIPALMRGADYKAGRLAIVVTFDEDEGASTGKILTVVVAPGLHGTASSAHLDHRSWSRWMTDLVGAAPLRGAASATSLGKAFGL